MKRLTLEDLQKYAAALNWQLLSTEYKTSGTKYLWQCNKGHILQQTLDGLRDGKGCAKCSGKLQYNITELQEYAISKNGFLLSTEYKNTNAVVKWQCDKGHTWDACWSSVNNQGSWCPICEMETRGTDLIGNVFNRLTVISKTNERNATGSIKWLCKCSCGNEILVRTDSLTTGHTNSCGCYNKDRIFESNAQILTGLTFGRLTVVSLNPEYKKRKVSWVCKCSCGNTSIVGTQSLTTGKTKSCGCLMEEVSRKTTTLRNAQYRSLHKLNEPTASLKLRLRHRKLRNKILERDNTACVLCGSIENLQVHHIVPLCIALVNNTNNLVTLCRKCHFNKAHIPTNTSQVNEEVQQQLKIYINNLMIHEKSYV